MQTRVFLTLLSCMLAACPHAASASDTTPSGILLVLVTINAEGRVTEVTPPVKLRTNVRRLLESTVSELVVEPALSRGKAVASQMVFKLKTVAHKQTDGTYRLHFDFAGAEPLPYGSWHWITDSRHRYKLTNSSLAPRSDPLQHSSNTSMQELRNPNPHGAG